MFHPVSRELGSVSRKDVFYLFLQEKNVLKRGETG